MSWGILWSAGRDAREQSYHLVAGLLGNDDLASISQIILRRFEQVPPERAFAVQLVLRLRHFHPTVGTILVWLDKRLDVRGTTSDEVAHAEHFA